MQALIEACRAAPDDDAPRLVLADALGGDRGELVVLELAIADGGGSREMRQRHRALLAAHGVAWSGLAGLAKRVIFRRGFVDAIEIGADVLAERAHEVFAAAPLIRHVVLADTTLWGSYTDEPNALSPVAAALSRPELRRIEGLGLGAVGTMYPGDAVGVPATYYGRDTDALALVAAADLPLTALGLPRLDAAPDLHLPTLARLAGGLPLGDLLAIAPRPTALQLADRGADLTALPDSLTELDLDDVQLWDLPIAPRLERATLDLPQLVHEPRRLEHFTALRSLTIRAVAAPLYERGTDQLRALVHPTLREIRASSLGVAATFALARALGPQLALLDLRGSAAELHARRADLAELVAGEVVTGAYVEPRLVQFLSRRPRELLWDAPVVELPR